MSKDCNMVCHKDMMNASQCHSAASQLVVMIVVSISVLLQPAKAGSIRTYDSAVVTNDQVRLSDVASLSGFSYSQGQELADFVIAGAPQPGATSTIILQSIRDALRRQGVNFATLTFHGATRCQVSRIISNAPAKPNRIRLSQSASPSPMATVEVRVNKSLDLSNHDDYLATNPHGTLRQAVVEFFQQDLQQYPGIVDVSFGRHSEQVMGLSSPSYQFRISRSSKARLGLTSVRVDIVAEEKVIQTIPLAIRVTLTRSLLSAKHAINAKATIRPTDVELIPIVVTALDRDMLHEPSLAIGLRADRFIPSGTLLKPTMLESVPMVTRGQLVRLTSIAGSVSVVTAAKAGEIGHLGEVITVRSVDNKRIEFSATVVGPGRVQIGGKLPRARGVVQAGGRRS